MSILTREEQPAEDRGENDQSEPIRSYSEGISFSHCQTPCRQDALWASIVLQKALRKRYEVPGHCRVLVDQEGGTAGGRMTRGATHIGSQAVVVVSSGFRLSRTMGAGRVTVMPIGNLAGGRAIAITAVTSLGSCPVLPST